MNQRIYSEFLSALDAIVNEEAPAQDKERALQEVLSETDKTNLDELLSWDLDLGPEDTELEPEDEDESDLDLVEADEK